MIPDYQSLMRPVLEHAQDGEDRGGRSNDTLGNQSQFVIVIDSVAQSPDQQLFNIMSLGALYG